MAFAVLGLVALPLGCRSGHYQAADLPPSLLANSRVDSRQMQIAGLTASVASSNVIGPGDLVEVTVRSGMETEPVDPHALRVAADGALDVPIVGPVRVSGADASGAERLIAQAAISRGLYRHPNVHVNVSEPATKRITVLGAVNTPGVHEVPASACHLISALAAAGGMTEDAGTQVEVVRQPTGDVVASSNGDGVELVGYEQGTPGAIEPVTERVDLSLTASQSTKTLNDGDVVMVLPSEDRAIHVSGLVNRPDQFELPHDQEVRLLDAIALAGGRTSPVADRVLVIRQRPDGAPAVIAVSIRRAKKNGPDNLVLVAGDLVSVESSVATSVLEATKSFLRVTLGVTRTGVSL